MLVTLLTGPTPGANHSVWSAETGIFLPSRDRVTVKVVSVRTLMLCANVPAGTVTDSGSWTVTTALTCSASLFPPSRSRSSPTSRLRSSWTKLAPACSGKIAIG